jgi:hypothetical protein
VHHDHETIRRLLERDLIEWADNADLRLIWADFMQLDGQAIGRLVVLDHVGEGEGEAAAQARAEAAALRQSLAATLWQHDISTIPGVRLHWQRGFVRELEVFVEQLPGPVVAARTQPRARGRRGQPIHSRLDTLTWLMGVALVQPALRWVEVIRIHTQEYVRGSLWLYGAVHSATLREVHVGEPPRLRMRPPGAWESNSYPRALANADQLIGQFPRLRWLTHDGELARLPCCAGQPQTRLHFLTKLADRPLTSANRAALARALWDASTLVHNQAFAGAQKLGPRAVFLLDDLALFLVPPLSKKDPRPSHALRTLAAIGDASAALLPEALANAEVLCEAHERREALMVWLAALGPLAKRALPLVDAVLTKQPRELPASLTSAAALARTRIG